MLEAGRKVREQPSIETTGESAGNGHRNVIKSLMLIPLRGLVGPGFRDVISCTLTAFLQS